MTTSTATYDPTTTATSLAKAYTDAAQTQLTSQVTDASTTGTALTTLQTALTTFDTALTNLGSKGNAVAASATFSSNVGTATASSTAVPGTYSFFVQQTAAASQVAFQNVPGTPLAGAGPLVVRLASGTSFNVNLSTADTNGDGVLSPTEIAAAINQAQDNNSQVTASLITVGGQSQMVLTANKTGAANSVSLDASGIPDAALKSALSNGNTLVAGQDAIVWLGAKDTGIKLQQASNTYTAIAGVSMNFTSAMTDGQAPATLTVATDTTGTASNVQAFVNAYNALNTTLDTLTSHGNPTHNVAAGVFADDSGVNTLRSRLTSGIRQAIGGVSLANYGVTADSSGVLSLDTTQLNAKLATHPSGLTAVLGSTGNLPSGVLGSLDSYLNQWTSASTGQITQRQASLTSLQSSLTDRQTTLDNDYNSAYSRYLAQFTALQTLQSQMSQTSDLFTALFSSSTTG